MREAIRNQWSGIDGGVVTKVYVVRPACSNAAQGCRRPARHGDTMCSKCRDQWSALERAAEKRQARQLARELREQELVERFRAVGRWAVRGLWASLLVGVGAAVSYLAYVYGAELLRWLGWL